MSYRALLSIGDLSRDEVLALTQLDGPEDERRFEGVTALFFEQASLRTMFGFAAASSAIGLTPVPLPAVKDGFKETVDPLDELRNLGLLGARVVICRLAHALRREDLRRVLDVVPVVNAGDGENEHPSQALIDIAAMRSAGLEGKTVLLLGNLRDHRTVHSLLIGLKHFECEVVCFSHEGFAPDARFVGPRQRIAFYEDRRQREELFRRADFFYVTPFRYYSAPNERDEMGTLSLRKEDQRLFKPDAKILHPFPRWSELDPALDDTPFDLYTPRTALSGRIRQRVLRWALASG